MSTVPEGLAAALADRYRIERMLGEGGMAVVYLAEDLKHHRQVAIKVLRPEFATTLGPARFLSEILFTARLRHPSILQLYDSGEADSQLYYVMPYIQGESLRARLERERVLSIPEALRIAREVADALRYAHGEGVLHRDIKPENILLEGDRVFVADFGIARAITQAGGERLSQTGFSPGTPSYMSPEQGLGTDPLDGRSDQYSLGCVLFELLLGDPPFFSSRPEAIIARRASEPPPRLRSVRHTVPVAVEELVIRMLASHPPDRYPDMAAVVHEIEARRDGGPVRPEVPPAMWFRLAASVLVFVAAVATLSLLWRRRDSSSVRPPVVTGRSRGSLAPARIAVLDLVDRSGDHALEGLGIGLADELTRALGGELATSGDSLNNSKQARDVPGPVLIVISRDAVTQATRLTHDSDSLAALLGAGTLIYGTVERVGELIQTSIWLVDGETGIAHDPVVRSTQRSKVFSLPAALAEEAGRLLATSLGRPVHLPARERPPSTLSQSAYLIVQSARRMIRLGEDAAVKNDSLARDHSFTVADSLLAAAEKDDPKWVEPIVLRGLVAYRRSRLPPLDHRVVTRWVAIGRGHVDRALALHSKDADALEVRGNLRYWSYLMGLEPDHTKARALLDQAKSDLEMATQINPAQAGAWASLSHLYYSYPTTTAVDVNLAARRALTANPLLSNADVILDRLFLSSLDLGEFPDADHWCGETRRRFPTHAAAPKCELWMLTTKARPPDVARAWQLADSVTALNPDPRQKVSQLEADMMVATVLARAGQADSARHVIERSKGNAEIDPARTLALLGAFAYAQLGDKEAAIDMLKIYLAVNEGSRSGFAQDPGWMFRSLVDDPRFKQLVNAKR